MQWNVVVLLPKHSPINRNLDSYSYSCLCEHSLRRIMSVVLVTLLSIGFPCFFEVWKVLDFFLKIPRLGKSWKNILENHTFFRRLRRKSFFFCLLRSQITCNPLLLNLSCSYVILKHSWAAKGSWKIFRGGAGKSPKSRGFFSVSKRVGTLCLSVRFAFQVHLCRAKVAAHSCHFYNQVESKSVLFLFFIFCFVTIIFVQHIIVSC